MLLGSDTNTMNAKGVGRIVSEAMCEAERFEKCAVKRQMAV